MLRTGILWLWRAEAPLCDDAQACLCGGFSCCEAWALGNAGSVVEAHGLGCSPAYEIFLD